MKLIAGLGNPGGQYLKTRHNLGFMMLDFLAKKTFLDFKFNKKFKSFLAIEDFGKEKVILALPQTFMNNSGESIKKIADYYQIETRDIWIIHDDLDLPLGKIRIKRGGSSGGHQGVESIISRLKNKDFIRFKIGIKPIEKKVSTEKFVLRNFSKKEEKIIQESADKIVQAMENALSEGIMKTMNDFN